MNARAPAGLSVLLLEVNEADAHFIDRFTKEGKLPAFRELLARGARCRTRVPGWDATETRAWRHISPWIVWPSLYSGLTPQEHGLVAFGQVNDTIRDRCIWDVLDAAGVPVGVFGSLQSYPPRNHGSCRFYVPEALADDADCIPASARPLQELFILGARNYSESFVGKAARATSLLLRSRRTGVSKRSMARTLAQVPAELVRGARQVPERAVLHTHLSRDAFLHLYRAGRPRFATLHVNHVAYMQHRYWRAAEPSRFSAELGPADARFFGSLQEREDAERVHATRIERSLEVVDDLLAELMATIDDDTVLLLATGLGQEPMDPVGQIHNPVVRLVAPDGLFRLLGLRGFEVLHQMNPDLTANFGSEEEAAHAERQLAGLYIDLEEALFDIVRVGRQVFLELRVPPCAWSPDHQHIRHRELPLVERWSDWIHVHPSREQSTAHHHDQGLLIAWSRGHRIEATANILPVTDVAPNILGWFGVPIPEWMNPDPVAAFDVR